MTAPNASGQPPRYMLLEADVLDALRLMPDNSADACLTDVPYGLGTREPTAKEIAQYLLGDDGLNLGGDFMGAKWQIPPVAVWRELLRVLRPGAPVLSFAGSRTQDLIAIGVRAGGFEIQDTIVAVMWVYGEGMPKPAMPTDKYIDKHLGAEREVVGSRVLTGNAAVSTKKKGGTYGIGVGTVPPKTVPVTAAATPTAKRWEGYGQALAPAYEPIILAFKPMAATIAENILAHDVGALNIPGCRVGTAGGTKKVDASRYRTNGLALEGLVDGSLNGGVKASIAAGRWAKNVLLAHSPECRSIGTREVKSGTAVKRNGVRNAGAIDGMRALGTYPEGTPDAGYAVSGKEETDAWDCVPNCPSRLLDEQSGDRPSTLTGRADPAVRHENRGDNGGRSAFGGGNSAVYADGGGASRFFWHAKVARGERELGCEHLPVRKHGLTPDEDIRNDGPCVKPIELTHYLATLALPPARPVGPPRRILNLYMGTASEAIGALRAGWDEVVGIERDPAYVAIASARIERWEEARRNRPEFDEAEVVASADKTTRRQASLFAGGSK